MKPINRFIHHLAKLEELLKRSSEQPDAATWLYKNGARTPAFMLEALCKVYKDLDEKKFDKLKNRFKQLEDAIGDLDHYAAFSEEFKNDASIPGGIKRYTDEQAIAAREKLNDLLTEEKWISRSFKRIRKIKEKLEGIEWPGNEEETVIIRKHYEEDITEILEFYEKTGKIFTHTEDHVHELRRKLRWLSIYPHALVGKIQFSNDAVNEDELRQYQTVEIVGSPFNRFPEPVDEKSVLVLNRPHFLALSWMIAEFGILKDEGLKYFVLEEAANSTGIDYPVKDQTEVMLQRSTVIAKEFFERNVLNNLLAQ